MLLEHSGLIDSTVRGRVIKLEVVVKDVLAAGLKLKFLYVR